MASANGSIGFLLRPDKTPCRARLRGRVELLLGGTGVGAAVRDRGLRETPVPAWVTGKRKEMAGTVLRRHAVHGPWRTG
jgi:hypothetical protein